MPHGLLDVVAEDPEEEHVPAEVKPARRVVQEHAREDGEHVLGGRRDELCRHEAEVFEEQSSRVAAADRQALEQEHQHVRCQEQVVDDREAAGREPIADRDHRTSV